MFLVAETISETREHLGPETIPLGPDIARLHPRRGSLHSVRLTNIPFRHPLLFPRHWARRIGVCVGGLKTKRKILYSFTLQYCPLSFSTTVHSPHIYTPRENSGVTGSLQAEGHRYDRLSTSTDPTMVKYVEGGGNGEK